MKYLFFDIECSNNYDGKGKICEFGYVITDQNFTILEKNTFVMSPGNDKSCRFDKKLPLIDKDFSWAYDFDYYYKQEEFPFFYEKIKLLLNSEKYMIFGYAVNNDIRYLNSTTERYQLDILDFKAYEVGKITNLYFSEKENKISGLQKIFIEICGTEELENLKHHYSEDDAYMTMRIVQKICFLLNLSLEEIINKIKLNSQKSKVKKTNIERKKYSKKAKLKWKCFCSLYEQDVKNNKNQIIIYISSDIQGDEELVSKVITYINNNHHLPSKKAMCSDYIVVIDKKQGDLLKKAMLEISNAKIIIINDFLSGKFEKSW